MRGVRPLPMSAANEETARMIGKQTPTPVMARSPIPGMRARNSLSTMV